MQCHPDTLGMYATAYTAPGAVHGVGQVVGYSDAPQFCIRRADGSTFWWRADLCREMTQNDTELVERSSPMNEPLEIKPGDWLPTAFPKAQIIPIRFIRVGDYVINLDTVAHAEGMNAASPVIFLSFTDGRQHIFEGADATALRAFFAENAMDIMREAWSSTAG